jgi:hypothetical protein
VKQYHIPLYVGVNHGYKRNKISTDMENERGNKRARVTGGSLVIGVKLPFKVLYDQALLI